MKALTGVNLAERRLATISAELREQGACRTRSLAEQLGTSEMTIRRDLEELERQGVARRVHGGAVLANSDRTYGERSQLGEREKILIGRRAVQLLRPGQTVFFDTGTTAMAAARELRARQDFLPRLHLVTHAVNIAAELALQGGWSVHVIGGELYHPSCGTASPEAIKRIRRLNFDVFFLGACGVHPERHLTNTNVIEATMKQEIQARSAVTYLLADHRKWGEVTLAPIFPLAQVAGWVTDPGIPDEARRAAQAAGVTVHVADSASHKEVRT